MQANCDNVKGSMFAFSLQITDEAGETDKTEAD